MTARELARELKHDLGELAGWGLPSGPYPRHTSPRHRPEQRRCLL